jgi:hypothetical protein
MVSVLITHDNISFNVTKVYETGYKMLTRVIKKNKDNTSYTTCQKKNH